MYSTCGSDKLVTLLMVALVLSLARPVCARVVGMTYARGFARGETDPRRVPCEHLWGRILVLPWERLGEALGLLDGGQYAGDLWTEPSEVARRLAAGHPATSAPDTIVGIGGWPGQKAPRTIAVLGFEMAETEAFLTSRMFRLPEERSGWLLANADRWNNLKLVAPPLDGVSLFFYASFTSDRSGGVKVRDFGTGELFDFQGFCNQYPHQPYQDADDRIWDLNVRTTDNKPAWLRYSLMYGAVALVLPGITDTDQYDPRALMEVQKLVRVFDSAKPVKLNELTDLTALDPALIGKRLGAQWPRQVIAGVVGVVSLLVGFLLGRVRRRRPLTANSSKANA